MANDLFQTPVPKLYRAYLVPTLIALTSNSLYCLADVFFISKGSGADGLAALNIAMPLFTIFSAVGLIFGVGGSTIMSIAEGSKQTHERDKAFSVCMYAMMIIGILFSIGFSIFWKPLAYAFGGSEALMPMIKEYMIPITIGSLAYILMYSSTILLRNDHAPKLAMKATLIGNLTNIFLDWLFVMVFHMGISGAAIATSISTVLTLLCMLPHFICKRNTVHFVRDVFDFALWKRVVINGFGSGILEITSGIVVVIFNFVILRYGNDRYLAAFAIITNIAYVCKGMLNGFAQGAQPIISANYGARQMDRVKQAMQIALRYTLLFAAGLYIIFFIFPQSVASIFANGDEQLISYAASGIRMYFSGLVCMGAMTVFLYYFQSIERGNLASVLAFAKGFLFVIIALYVLLYTVGINGVWFAVSLGETFALLCSLCIMWKGNLV